MRSSAAWLSQFVQSFISPLLALVGGQRNFSNLAFKVNNARFTYGAFLTEVLSFLISAAVAYFLVVIPVSRALELFERDHAATERDCPECTMSIPIAAHRGPPLPAVHGGRLMPLRPIPPEIGSAVTGLRKARGTGRLIGVSVGCRGTWAGTCQGGVGQACGAAGGLALNGAI